MCGGVVVCVRVFVCVCVCVCVCESESLLSVSTEFLPLVSLHSLRCTGSYVVVVVF